MTEYTTQIAVIAGGPSGLSAAVQAAEDGAEVIVLEKAATVGGAANMVHEFRGWKDVAYPEGAENGGDGDGRIKRAVYPKRATVPGRDYESVCP